jgi:hypothetical protein
MDQKPDLIKISINFGAMVEPIKDQLKRQDVDFDYRQINLLQLDSDAITRLLIQGLISESVAHKSREKLMKKIVKLCKHRNILK